MQWSVSSAYSSNCVSVCHNCVGVYVWMYMYVHMCIYFYMCMMSSNTTVCVLGRFVKVYVRVSMCVSGYARLQMHEYTYKCISHVCSYLCACIYIRVYISIVCGMRSGVMVCFLGMFVKLCLSVSKLCGWIYVYIHVCTYVYISL